MRDSVFLCNLALWLIVLFPSKVISLELNYEFGTQYRSSENILLVSDQQIEPPQSEITQVTFLNFQLEENSADLRAQFNADIRHSAYRNDTFNNESDTSINAELLWDISPRRYSWYFFERYTQLEEDANNIQTIENQQNINEIISGPNFRWQLGRANWLELDARLYSYYFEASDADNERVSTIFRWIKSLVPGLDINITYDMLTTEFQDESVNTNFTRASTFVGFNYERSVNNVQLNLGKSRLSDDNTSVDDSDYVDLIATRQISASSNVSMSFRQDIGDSSSELENGLSIVAGNFKQKSSSIQYTQSTTTGSWGIHFVSVIRNDVISADYEVEDNLTLDLNRVVGVGSRISIAFQTTNQEIENALLGNYTDTINSAVITYDHRFSRRLSVTLSSEKLDRISTEQLRNYKDERIQITLSFRG